MGNVIIKLVLDFLTTSNWLEQSIFIKPQGTDNERLPQTDRRKEVNYREKLSACHCFHLYETLAQESA